MATVKPTPKKERGLPSTEGMIDENVRNAFEKTNIALSKLQDNKITQEIFEYLKTAQAQGVLNNIIWAFINKNFIEEQMVRDATPQTTDLDLASKRYYVLPSNIPGNRKLEIDMESITSGSNVANGLGNGYFKITQIDDTNTVRILDGANTSLSVSGYVVENNRFVPVTKQDSIPITQNVFVFLRLSDKEFEFINRPASPSTDFSGKVLIGKIDVDGDGVITIIQEHVGPVWNNFGSEPFDIMLASETSVLVKGGDFGVNDVIETIADDTTTIPGTRIIYVQTDATGSPAFQQVTALPAHDPLIARTPIGKVYFSSGKITRIEQYIRGWFHCHTWGDCDA